MIADACCTLKIRTHAAQVVVGDDRREEVEVDHVCECKATHGCQAQQADRRHAMRRGQCDALPSSGARQTTSDVAAAETRAVRRMEDGIVTSVARTHFALYEIFRSNVHTLPLEILVLPQPWTQWQTPTRCTATPQTCHARTLRNRTDTVLVATPYDRAAAL